jgi:hypothetical protein
MRAFEVAESFCAVECTSEVHSRLQSQQLPVFGIDDTFVGALCCLQCIHASPTPSV